MNTHDHDIAAAVMRGSAIHCACGHAIYANNRVQARRLFDQHRASVGRSSLKFRAAWRREAGKDVAPEARRARIATRRAAARAAAAAN